MSRDDRHPRLGEDRTAHLIFKLMSRLQASQPGVPAPVSPTPLMFTVRIPEDKNWIALLSVVLRSDAWKFLTESSMPSSQLLPRCYHVAEDRVVYLILGYSCICSSHRRLQIPLQWGGARQELLTLKALRLVP